MARNKIRTLLLVGLCTGAALIAYFGFGVARATPRQPAPFRPLAASGLGAAGRQFVIRAAEQAGIPAANISEAGSADVGSPYRATVVGFDTAKTPWVAFTSSYATTGFIRAEDALAGHSMVALEGTQGAPSNLEEVGLSVVVTSNVATVEVEAVDGSTSSLALTKWPGTAYASASVSATSPNAFPRSVRAYDASGNVLDQQEIKLPPTG